MHVILGRNASEILPLGLEYLLREGQSADSRDGKVLVAPGPVTLVYTHPEECVATNPVRDRNPFFAVAEALWMLAGRQDSAFLDKYVRDFGSRFAEDDGRIAGAYGWRWRSAFGFDQLAGVVSKLRNDPNTRQCVLQMWNPEQDLLTSVRDRPCNQSVVFRIREGRLDMAVWCRSNDFVMGAAGENSSHFVFLHQYVCGMLGIPSGTYHQIAMDMHIYQRDLEKLSKRAGLPCSDPAFVGALSTPYAGRPEPLVTYPDSFDAELRFFMGRAENDDWENFPSLQNTFLSRTALPMLKAHSEFKAGKPGYAMLTLLHIQAEDWAGAAGQWLARRIKK